MYPAASYFYRGWTGGKFRVYVPLLIPALHEQRVMPEYALAITAPNAERLVSDDLARLSYPHVWFKRRSSVVITGRIHERVLPAFPRYIFVAIEACWDALRDVGRILGLVQFGDQLGIVPARVVDQLIARCGGGDVLPPEEIPEPFRRGDRVIVGGYGPASGQQAVYDSLVEHGKLRLMFDMMGRVVPIDIDGRDVSAFTSRPAEGRKRKRRRRSRRRLGPTVP